MEVYGLSARPGIWTLFWDGSGVAGVALEFHKLGPCHESPSTLKRSVRLLLLPSPTIIQTK